MSKYIEFYKCNECGALWMHEWDVEDKNNDFTQCPNLCDNFDFDEITDEEYYCKKKINKFMES